MSSIRLLHHRPESSGLHSLGLSPNLRPSGGLLKPQYLLNMHALWAQERPQAELRQVVMTALVVVI